jgi:transcriptional regulator with XRE-family HTH domain
MAERNSKKAVITPEQKGECARLREIWDSLQPPLKQVDAAKVLGVSQSAVSQMLNGTQAISARLALPLANLLKCQVSDFSPRLAGQIVYKAAEDDTGVTAEEPTPEPYSTAEIFAVTVDDAVSHLAQTIERVPERSRPAIADELRLLASVPDSPMLVKRISKTLRSYDRPTVPARVVSFIEAKKVSHGELLAEHLNEIQDPTTRHRMFVVLDELIAQVLRDIRNKETTAEARLHDLESRISLAHQL